MAALLVVENDAFVLDALCTALTEFGHSVERATDGIAALDILDQGRGLDLLITDVVMPGLNGYNLSLMARERRPGLKVLYMSGNTEIDDIRRKLGAQSGKLLQKPFRLGSLEKAVAQALAGEAS